MAKHKVKKKYKVDLSHLSMTLIKANLIGYALTGTIILFASILLTYTNFGANFEKWIVLLGMVASAALVGFDTAKMEGKNGYKWGFVGGLSYLVIFILITLVVTGAKNMNFSVLLTLTILSLLSSSLAGMVSIATEK